MVRVFSFYIWFSMLLLSSLPTFAEKHAIVICGSGGTVDYIEKFNDWGQRLTTALKEDLGFNESNVTFFSADIADSTDVGAIHCDADILEFHFNLILDEFSSSDDLYLFMIGHGSFINNAVSFHLPGDNLTASKMNEWFSELNYKHLILVNGSSSSAGFINKLSGEGRVICTSTKNVTENNAPEFMEHFIQAITDGSADINRDERITVFEVCSQAAVLTQAWYDQEGYIATEHALIDDNGDGLGTRLIPEVVVEEEKDTIIQNQNLDGKKADSIYFKDYQFPESAPKDKINEYISILEEIRAYTSKKDELDRNIYYQQLESKLIKAASLHHFIRSFH